MVGGLLKGGHFKRTFTVSLLSGQQQRGRLHRRSSSSSSAAASAASSAASAASATPARPAVAPTRAACARAVRSSPNCARLKGGGAIPAEARRVDERISFVPRYDWVHGAVRVGGGDRPIRNPTYAPFVLPRVPNFFVGFMAFMAEVAPQDKSSNG